MTSEFQSNEDRQPRRGRPERALSGDGPLIRFARHLRDLRRQSGLTVQEVAEAMHYSASVVSRMASGHELPSWELTSRFVLVCDGDVKAWRRLWAATASALSARLPDTDPGVAAQPENADSPAEYLAQLRVRISQVESASYRWLSRRTGYAHSTIAAALSESAVRLPKWRLVSSVLNALGEQEHRVAVWHEVWQTLHQEALLADQRSGFNRASRTPETYPSVVAVAPPVGLRDPERRVRGRDKLIEQLVELVAGEHAAEEPGVHVLHGMGGAGKTMVALEVATAVAEQGWRVWWVSAGESASLVAGMTTVSRDLGASEEELRRFDPADVLWRRLANEPDRWLLVIDGADDPCVLDTDHGGFINQGTGWIRPSANHGLVLVTTRYRRWPNWCRRREVSELTIDDAAQVLLDHSGLQAGQTEDAEELAQRLGRLPLALKLAGCYLARTANAPLPDPAAATTFRAYLARLEAMEVQEAKSGEMVDAIHRVWDLSLELLTRRGWPDADQLLRLLAMFADAPIPYRALFTAESLKGTGLRQPTMARVSNLLEALSQVSLIDLEPGEEVRLAKLHIHPLVRTVGRVHPETTKRTLKYVADAVKLVHDACVTIQPPDHPPSWPAWGLVAPHALHLLESVVKAQAPEHLVRKAGIAAVLAVRSMLARGEFFAAERQLRVVLDCVRQVFGEDDRDTLRVWHEQATALRKIGRYPEAELANRAAWEISARLLGEDDPDSLTIRRDLAIVHLELGRYRESESALREVSELRRKVLGDEHPDTLSTRHGLARVLCELGRYIEAREVFEEVYQARVKVLGREHPDTLTTLRNVARVLDDLGRYVEARGIYFDLYETCVRVLGEEHPDTLLARFDLGKNRLNHGHFKEAESEFQKVLEARHRLLGEEHPRTLTTRRYLAMALHSLGLWQDAEAEYNEVFQRRKKLLGQMHPHTLSARFNLALVRRDRGRFKDADFELRAVYEEQAKQLGDDHKDTLNTLHELAVTLRELGLYAEAEQVLSEVCERRTRVLGAEHPDTLRGRRDRAGLLLALDRNSDAWREYIDVHRLSINVLGSEHPETLHARNDLAKLYRYMQDNDAAREELEAVLELRCRVLGPDHPDTLTTRRNLARIMHASGDIDRAEGEYKTVLDARLKLYGEEHPYTLIAFNNLGRVHADRGQLAEAECEFRRVHQARERLLGAEHPDTLATQHELGHVLLKLGRSDEASCVLSEVLQTRTRLFGPEHRDTTATMAALKLMNTAVTVDQPR